jgi:hypothetical protein
MMNYNKYVRIQRVEYQRNPKNSKLSPVAAANLNIFYLFTEKSDRRSLQWKVTLIY